MPVYEEGYCPGLHLRPPGRLALLSHNPDCVNGAAHSGECHGTAGKTESRGGFGSQSPEGNSRVESPQDKARGLSYGAALSFSLETL